MTILVFNKPLSSITFHKYPIFSIHTNADAEITDEYVEVKGISTDRWHGLKIEMQHIASVYRFTPVGGVAMLENGYPKSNNTCS